MLPLDRSSISFIGGSLTVYPLAPINFPFSVADLLLSDKCYRFDFSSQERKEEKKGLDLQKNEENISEGDFWKEKINSQM